MWIFLSTLSLRRATNDCRTWTFEHLFLSTLSLRRATGHRLYRRGSRWISIHALLAESDYFGLREVYTRGISIHALLAESDDGIITRGQLPTTFLSTLSLRRATLMRYRIRARYTNFYPRSPCGERPIFAVRPYDAPIFLSTLSLRRATKSKS